MGGVVCVFKGSAWLLEYPNIPNRRLKYSNTCETILKTHAFSKWKKE